MSKQFTPGPWEVEETDDGHVIRMGEAVTSPHLYASHLVCEYLHGCFYDAEYPETDGDNLQALEAEANAYLIASAPEMHDNLSEILTLVALIDTPLDQNILKIITLCEQALAKAQGLGEDE